MLLVIDIGNTHSVIGVIKNDKIIRHWRITSQFVRTEDEIGMLVLNYFSQSGLDINDINGACISSVVPNLSTSFIWMCQKYLNIEPLIINNKLKLGMQIKYEDPSAVGADRICNAIAAREKYGLPAIVLDFGTATTFDCIDSNGDYLGGIIAPGVETSISTLHHKAAKLPKVDIKVPEKIIGSTTDESIQIGIVKGAIHLVNGLVAEIKIKLGQNSKVIATGGLAKVIAQNTEIIDHVDSDLCLDGMRIIYHLNRKADGK